MSDHDDAVRELASAYGVAVDYWDWQGRHMVVPTDSTEMAGPGRKLPIASPRIVQ